MINLHFNTQNWVALFLKKELYLILLTFSLISCDIKKETKKTLDEEKKEVSIPNHVITKEDQNKLTPDIILKELIAGNRRFQSGKSTTRDHSEQTRKAAFGQYPKAVILSCVDSRVPVEDVFDQGIGDLFICRIAGNFINEDILGSIEYSCKVAGAKVVIVMGHQHCGAVKGAINNVVLGNITGMLAKIKPAILKSQDFNGEQSSKNEDYVKHVCKNNVVIAIENIRIKSPILKEMEENGEIKIVGAYYDVSSGTADLFNQTVFHL